MGVPNEQDDLLSEASSTAFPPTPTSTTPTGSVNGEPAYESAVPWPGRTFKIVDEDKHRAISLVMGNLQLEKDFSQHGSWHWLCVGKKGWLGFRNKASGMFMGHTIDMSITANQPHDLSWDHFCAVRHPDGGYVLRVKHGKKDQNLWNVCIDETENCLVARGAEESEGARWRFLWVDKDNTDKRISLV
ncbi:hypothetical protein F5884DRAFT_509390 [Xylogone sp. PMI_703]|nr:hypothetical protein F5884DRAFT_509390 [Xylogone sp. PMI_703]